MNLKVIMIVLTIMITALTITNAWAGEIQGTIDVYTNLTLKDAQVRQNQINPLVDMFLAYGDNVTVNDVILGVYLDNNFIGNFVVTNNTTTVLLPRLSPGKHAILLEVAEIPRANVYDYVTGEVIPLVVDLTATQNRDAIAITKGEVGKLTLTLTNKGNVPLKVTADLKHSASGNVLDSKTVTIPANSNIQVTLAHDPQSNTDYEWVVHDGVYTYAQGDFRILVYGGGAVPVAPSGGGGTLTEEAIEYIEKQRQLENVIFYVIAEVFGYKIQLWLPFALLGIYGLIKDDKNLAMIGFGFLAFFYVASPWLIA